MNDLIIYNTEDGQANVSLLAKDGTVWCTQAQMAELFDRSVSTISRHIANILKENEPNEKSNLRFPQITTCRNSKVSHKKNNHSREVTEMVDISLAAVANSATVPSILQRSAKWQYLYFDRGIKAFLGCSDWIKVFYRKEGLS